MGPMWYIEGCAIAWPFIGWHTEARVLKEVKVGLVLNESEAQWPKGYLQNSFVENEDTETTKMRHLFFDALRKTGI